MVPWRATSNQSPHSPPTLCCFLSSFPLTCPISQPTSTIIYISQELISAPPSQTVYITPLSAGSLFFRHFGLCDVFMLRTIQNACVMCDDFFSLPYKLLLELFIHTAITNKTGFVSFFCQQNSSPPLILFGRIVGKKPRTLTLPR